jgi:hypothetical protein
MNVPPGKLNRKFAPRTYLRMRVMIERCAGVNTGTPDFPILETA